ncbi:MAG: M28 family peptidase [Verrucomicrobiales bacterium]|nr:M28 family peptidase [Verrucomicrobiales bacterium]
MLIAKLKPDTSDGTLEHKALDEVSPASLRRVVEDLAYPRHYQVNHESNQKARDWICEELRSWGYEVTCEGRYDNVIARRRGSCLEPLILLGAHYDTVPTTPGADDNNSAIAVCLEAAKVLALHSEAPLMIAVFNCEEDGLLGSRDFVKNLGTQINDEIAQAHIFEMVGYYSDAPNSQSKPAGLPVPMPSVGDFIGMLSNAPSNKIAKQVLAVSKRIGGSTPVLSLKTFFGIEKIFGDLLRSDHTPFWEAEVPALMWTDTSEFRNPNYHAPTDTPDTLNYHAMADVTRMIVAHILVSTGEVE